MTERPILFSAAMVRAILEDRKTQTRRAVKPKTSGRFLGYIPERTSYWFAAGPLDQSSSELRCPYGAPGDRLWVREGFWYLRQSQQEMVGFADGTVRLLAGSTLLTTPPSEGHAGYGEAWKRKPSIHMPRWASRLTLEVTDVRVQRLQEISDKDAFSEGIQSAVDGGFRSDGSARDTFRLLWDSINGKRPGCAWADNPWVWCVSFRRLV
jgi:hypothetical protein